MKLRNRKSYMTSLPEGEAPKNAKASITQMIYFLVLIVAVGYIVFIFAKKYWYFEEIGVVEIEKTIISSSRGGQISNIFVSEGQFIKKKEKIAVIEALRTGCHVTDDGKVNKIRFEINNNKVKKKAIEAQLAGLEKEEKKFLLRRALELDRGLAKESERLRREKLTMVSDIDLLSGQINNQIQHLNNIIKAQKNVILPKECYSESIKSPFITKVSAVHKRPKEFAQRGEAIVTLIRNNAPIRIEVYLEKEILKSLNIGETLDLIFPDGVKSKGRISKIHSSAYASVQRQLEHYKPIESDIRVHLLPVNNKDRETWLNYDRMNVKVRGLK